MIPYLYTNLYYRNHSIYSILIYLIIYLFLAPGQESFLWNEIRKRLDDKLIPEYNYKGSNFEKDHKTSTDNEPKTPSNNQKTP